MRRNIVWAMVLLFSFAPLFASETLFIEPKVAIKMINNKNVKFISLGDTKTIISGSASLNINHLMEKNILGEMQCAPFNICPNKLKVYLESRGISSGKKLLLYDDVYGLNATTLYTILEAMGDKDIQIINGGIEEILKLDPNQKHYDKFLLEKASLYALENNSSNEENFKEKIISLDQKLALLEPLLLVKKSKVSTSIDQNISYVLDRKKFNFDYLIGVGELKKVVKFVREERVPKNRHIVDACALVDIVGNSNGSYIPGVISLDWKELLASKKGILKNNSDLEILFSKKGLEKENDIYVYCMSGTQKAFYVALALRQVNYTNVKVFSGDWSVWRGAKIE